jgi:acetyl esterase
LLEGGGHPMPSSKAGPVLEPEVQSFIEAVERQGGPPLYTLSPTAAREVLRQAQKGAQLPSGVDLEQRKIPGGPTGDVSVRLYRPKGATGELPAVIYIHGGGWVLGDEDTHERLLRELTLATNAAFVFVNYTPSPDARFPVAIEQAYAVATWVAAHGKEAMLNGRRLAIAGDSVGGNMAAAVTLMAKQRTGPQFASQALFYPVTDNRFDTASYEQFSGGPWLTREGMKWFWDQYLPDVKARENILASPLRASIEELKGLPPALVITDENDVLRDEGEAYVRKLYQARVKVVGVRYLGTVHDFMMLNGLAQTGPTRQAIQQAGRVLHDALYPR